MPGPPGPGNMSDVTGSTYVSVLTQVHGEGLSLSQVNVACTDGTGTLACLPAELHDGITINLLSNIPSSLLEHFW